MHIQSITIRKDYVLEKHEHKLRFNDYRPVVIGYCRVSEGSLAVQFEQSQMEANKATCKRRVGLGGYDMIWIGVYNKTKRGLNLAKELLRSRYAQYLVVERTDRLSRRFRQMLGIEESIETWRISDE